LSEATAAGGRGPAAAPPRATVASLRPAAEELAAAGDPLALRSIETLEKLDAAGWSSHLDELRRFNAAREEVESGRNADARLRPLEASPDPVIAVKATHFAAYGALLRGDESEARTALLRLRRHCAAIGCVEEPALVISDLGQPAPLFGRSGRCPARLCRGTGGVAPVLHVPVGRTLEQAGDCRTRSG
jgi:hypothetical protein